MKSYCFALFLVLLPMMGLAELTNKVLIIGIDGTMPQSLLQARGSILLPEFLPVLYEPAPPDTDAGQLHLLEFVAQRLEAGTQDLHGEVISRVERQLLRQVLERTKGNQLQAATILGISRVTLRSKIRSLGIDVGEFA